MAYSCLALDNAKTIASRARRSTNTSSRSSAIVIEAAIGSSPDAALPIRANDHVLRGAALEAKAAGAWADTALRENARIDDIGTLVVHHERHLRRSLSHVGDGLASHVMQCMKRGE